MNNPLSRFTGKANGVGASEDVHDFIGIVEIDPELAIIVMPDHVATIIETTGTDYRYAPPERVENILTAWERTLTYAGLHVQIFIDRRPINWDVPEGYLHSMEMTVEEAAKTARPRDAAWMRRRFERHANAIRAGELDRQTSAPLGTPIGVADLRQFFVIRRAIGRAEAVYREGEAPSYLPPRHGLRAMFSSVPRVFGGDEGPAAWRARRDAAAAALAEEVGRFMDDASGIPGISLRPLSGLEIAQSLHLLLRGDREAYNEWLDDASALRSILGREIAGGEISHTRVHRPLSPEGAEA